jgi:uncharacterized LabA/DUF88 family protein
MLKGKKKKIIVLAAWDRLSNKLEKAANQVIYLEDIKDQIVFEEDQETENPAIAGPILSDIESEL